MKIRITCNDKTWESDELEGNFGAERDEAEAFLGEDVDPDAYTMELIGGTELEKKVFEAYRNERSFDSYSVFDIMAFANEDDESAVRLLFVDDDDSHVDDGHEVVNAAAGDDSGEYLGVLCYGTGGSRGEAIAAAVAEALEELPPQIAWTIKADPAGMAKYPADFVIETAGGWHAIERAWSCSQFDG